MDDFRPTHLLDARIIEALNARLVAKDSSGMVNIGMKGASYFKADFVAQCVKELENAFVMAASSGEPLPATQQLVLHLLLDSAYIPAPKTDERGHCRMPA